jgi:hypothetical protein
VRESVVEKKVCKAARANGWWVLKLNIIGMIGFPDRLLLGPGGRIMFIEFKAPGRKPRASQVRIINKLRELGFEVYVIDNIEDGEKIVSRPLA